MILLYNIGIRLYSLAIHIAALFNTKARQWVDGRKGIFQHIETSLKHKNTPSKIIWIHVASLGEFEQGRPLIEALKQGKNPPYIILTFFSPSGYKIRKNYPLADAIFYLPIDTPSHAKRFIHLLKPDLAIFVKYEFWYHYLHELKKRAIPTYLISAIFNEKQVSNNSFYNILLKRMLSCFTHIFVQNTPSVSLLQNAGFQHVSLAGDTRVDRVISIAQEVKPFPIIEQFVGQSPTLVCGSTWQPDEEIILQLLEKQAFKHWKFIFAPHDISIKNVERLEKSISISYLKYSKCIKNIANTEGVDFYNSRILIMDNIGMLSSLYRYGKVAYIGGGFGKGIHNTLEPIAWGLPVIFGKKYQKFEEAVKLVETGGGFSVQNYAEFEQVMQHLNDDFNLKKASQAAMDYIQNNKGATRRIVEYIKATV